MTYRVVNPLLQDAAFHLRLIFTRESSNSVRPSVRLSVCHTGESVKNGASLDHQIFTVGCLEDSGEAFPYIRRGSP